MNGSGKQKRQEQAAQMERQVLCRKEIFAEYPEIKKFIETKERFFKILLLFGLVLYIFRTVMVRTVTGASVGALLVAFFMGYGMCAVMLFACMSANFKVSVCAGILCACAFGFQLARSLRSVALSGSLIRIIREIFQVYPWVVISDMCMILFFLLLCAVILWMSLLPENRRLAKQYEELLITWKPGAVSDDNKG